MAEPIKLKTGLALSGGGVRAAGFHLGSFRALNRLKVLDKVDVISTISGGSIIGAYYMLHKDKTFEQFDKDFEAALKKSVLGYALRTPAMLIRFFLILALPVALGFAIHHFNISWWILLAFILLELILLLIFQLSIFPLGESVRQAYDKFYFGEKKLPALSQEPLPAINATNLETGLPFTFSKKRAEDSTYSYMKPSVEFDVNEIPISTAVASSTCVPFLFNPVKLPKKAFKNPDDMSKVNPALIDGGVYDNQGIHKITVKNSEYCCDIIICSDGGAPFTKAYSTINSFAVLYRSTDIMMKRIRALQFLQDIYTDRRNEIAYYSLDWSEENAFKYLVKNIATGRVPKAIVDYYHLKPEWLADLKKYEAEVIAYLMNTIVGVNNMPEKPLTAAELVEVSAIPTTLRALTDREINLLTRHGARLTYIQVKLYCPALFS
jgi:NTE family protein